jgi:hypothetical protein
MAVASSKVDEKHFIKQHLMIRQLHGQQLIKKHQAKQH